MHYCQLSCFWIKSSGLEDLAYTRWGTHSFSLLFLNALHKKLEITYSILLFLVEQRAHRANWQDLSFLLDGLLSLFYLDWGLVWVFLLLEIAFMVWKTQVYLAFFLTSVQLIFLFYLRDVVKIKNHNWRIFTEAPYTFLLFFFFTSVGWGLQLSHLRS